MKINLLYNNTNQLNGYVNVDPFAKDDGRICADLDNLHFCSGGEAEEIIATSILSKYNDQQAYKMLSHWIELLSHNGILHITDINAYEVARKFVLAELNVEQFNQILFNGKSLLNFDVTLDFLKSCGLQILNKKIEGLTFTITAKRP